MFGKSLSQLPVVVSRLSEGRSNPGAEDALKAAFEAFGTVFVVKVCI